MLMDKEEKENKSVATGIVVGNEINQEVARLNRDYSKPVKYTGNRHRYDSASAKVNAKQELFKQGKIVRDPNSGAELLLRKQDAKLKYGPKWTEHLAETDHIVPVQKVHQEYKNDAWISDADIRDVTNDTDNLQVISRQQNNAKRAKTNEEFYGNEEYLEDKGIKLSAKARKKAIETGEKAQQDIDRKMLGKKISNIGKEFHNSGLQGAYSAGAMTAAISATNNIVAVIKGEVTPEEALKNVAKDTVTSASTSYMVTGSTAVIAQSLSRSSSPFIRSLVKSNVPGQVVSAVMATGGTLMKYCKGEINTRECIVELGQTGVSICATGYAMAVGQAIIPIPFVGAAVGAMVGAAMSGGLWRDLQAAIDSSDRARAEYEEAKRLSEQVRARLKQEREAFEKATQVLFAERAQAINEGFALICEASQDDDFDMLTAGLDTIARAFDKDIMIRNIDEFDVMMKDDNMAFEL